MLAPERKAVEFLEKKKWWILSAILLVASFIARKQVLYYLSGDMTFYLIGWFYEIASKGGFPALAQRVGNYNIPYQTLIALMTHFKGEAVFLIKYLSIFFDYVLAIAGVLLVNALSKDGKRATPLQQFLALTGTLFLPTVFLNAAVWGQCDAIFTSFLVFSALFFVKDKPLLGIVFFGLALSFKLQAIFFLPILLLYYVCRKRFSCLAFLLIPATLIVTSLPGIVYGRSLFDFWEIYSEQTITYLNTTLYYPNIYYFLPDDYVLLSKVGLLLTMFVLIAGFAAIHDRTVVQKRESKKEWMLYLIWSVFSCVIFLPGMHERYGFAVEIFAILFAIAYREMIFEAIAMVLIATLSYTPFLLNFDKVPMRVEAAANLLVYGFVTWRTFFKEGKSKQ